MTTRDHAPVGAPCWVDLWTSDVEGARRFYSQLFGWEAAEPSEEFGGYFMFLRDGVPVAGGMGAMGDMAPDDRWTPYFQTADAKRAAETASSLGGTPLFEPMPVADMGTQCVVVDPSGAKFGLWQPGTFEGFSTLNEQGAPSWFELHTPGFDEAIDFYTKVLGWRTDDIPGDQGIRYKIVHDADHEGVPVAGVLDASGMGSGPQWFTYWEVEDLDATAKSAESLGGKVVREPPDTPYGKLAWLEDPQGAPFNLRRA